MNTDSTPLSLDRASGGTGRGGFVVRQRLLDLLVDAPDTRLVVLQAPAGFGKSVLFDQWVERESRPVAKVDLSGPEGDSARLIDQLALALADAGLLGEGTHRGEDLSVGRGRRRAVADLIPLIDNVPGVLIIDHAEALDSHRARDVVTELVARLPESMTVAIGCRTVPFEGLAVHRSSPSTLELTSDVLAMTPDEIRCLAAAVCDDCTPEDVAAIHARTEGWPAAVYLSLHAALAGRRGSGLPLVSDEHAVRAYIRAELLDALSPARRAFAMQTAVLDELTAESCDYLLERTRSQQVLDALAESNLLVTPTDPQHRTFRYHGLLRDALLSDLRVRDPHGEVELRRRASDWYVVQKMPGEAARHAMAAGDEDRLAAIVASHARPLFDQGHGQTVHEWLEWFDEDGRRDRHPGVAMLATAATAASGDAVGSMRWKAVVDRHKDDPTPIRPIARVIDALTCQSGVDQMLVDARLAQDDLGADSEWYSTAVALEGAALLWKGDEAAARDRLRLGGELGERFGSMATAVYAYAALADIEMGHQERPEACANADHAMSLVDRYGLDYHFTSVLPMVMGARCAIVRGDPKASRFLLNRSYVARTTLCEAIPGFAAHSLIAMAETAVAIADISGARQVLREARGFVHSQSCGALEDRYDRVEAVLSSMPVGTATHQALTTAELRLLPYLRTHLSFPEIGERLFVSRHTVKTQAMSIYRKLGASTRSEAVTSAQELGLLDASYP